MKKTICIILILAFAALFGTSVYFIYDYYRQAKQQEELYDSLASIVESAADTEEYTEQIPYSEEKTLLPELAELYQKNDDLIGWLSIADTNINYPVMQSVNNPDFYLNHNFDREYSDYGCMCRRIAMCINPLITLSFTDIT